MSKIITNDIERINFVIKQNVITSTVNTHHFMKQWQYFKKKLKSFGMSAKKRQEISSA